VIPFVLPAGPIDDDLPLVLPVYPERFLKPLPVRRPHPGFWWSIAWCVALINAMQLPALVIVLPVFLVEMTRNLDRYAPKQSKAPNPAVAGQEATKDLLEGDLVKQATQWAQAVAEIAIIVFSLVTLRVIVGPDWKRRLALRRPAAAHCLLVLIGFPGMLILGEGAYQLSKLFIPDLKQLGLPIDLDEIMQSLGSWPLVFSLLVIAVGPAIGEELWCRGFLGQGLVGRYGTVVGVLLSSLWFGLIHMIPQQAFYAALMGVCLHFVYLTTRSLWLSMLLHFLNNGMAVLAMSKGANNEPNFPAVVKLLEAQEHSPHLIYPAAALLVAIVGAVLYWSRARLVAVGPQPAWQPEYPGVDWPPPDSGTVMSRPRPGWLAWLVVAAAVAAFGTAYYVALKREPEVPGKVEPVTSLATVPSARNTPRP
jgi:membrane protease YdiL (CAAX protease family)